MDCNLWNRMSTWQQPSSWSYSWQRKVCQEKA